MYGGITLEWIIENKEWLFSGLGLSIVGIIGYFLKRNKENNKNSQTITSGDDSTNIQGGKNVKVEIGSKNVK